MKVRLQMITPLFPAILRVLLSNTSPAETSVLLRTCTLMSMKEKRTSTQVTKSWERNIVKDGPHPAYPQALREGWNRLIKFILTFSRILLVYLCKCVSLNNYNADFIRRNIYRPTEADATDRNPTPVITVTIALILDPCNIRVAHKTTTTNYDFCWPTLKTEHLWDHRTDPRALQHTRSPQTYHHVTTFTAQV